MNYFFAVELSDEARQQTATLADTWRQRLSLRASWYDPADYHVTLKFLGDVPEERQSELIAAARPVAARAAPVDVRLRGAGAFPGPQRPNVLWRGVETSGPLTELAAQLDAAVGALGFRRDHRPYAPHVTVARVRDARPLPPTSWPDEHERLFSGFAAGHFVLMQTLPAAARRKDRPVRYNTVHLFPLGDTHS